MIGSNDNRRESHNRAFAEYVRVARAAHRDKAGDRGGSSLTSAVLPPEQAAKAEKAVDTKRKKARVTGRKSTVLAGRKIAEEQLKTKLGQ